MSNKILVIGESGTGKSTSMRNLDPKSTFIIKVFDKPLPFRTKKGDYKRLVVIGLKREDGNLYISDNYDRVEKCIKYISESRPDIKTIIVDDFQYIMANEFMRRARETGFNKFTEIAQHAWDVIMTESTRDDLNIYFLSHSEQTPEGKAKAKTIGKMLDEKITLEGLFTIVLHARIHDGKYIFSTQYTDQYLAKSPMGMLDPIMDNDLDLVNKKIDEYYNFETIEE